MATIKKVVSVIVISVLFLGTLMGAMGLTLEEEEDSFVMSNGESRDASFVISDINGSVTVSTTAEWLYFTSSGTRTASLDEEVTIVRDAKIARYEVYADTLPVGVHRAVITVEDDYESKVFNVKVNVLPKFLSSPYNTFKNLSTTQVVWGIILLISVSLILAGLFYKGVKG